MGDPARPNSEDEGQLRARVLRLEESAMLADRTVEQLHEVVLALGERVDEALARVRRLERRMEPAEAAAEEEPRGEPPEGPIA